MSFNGSRINLCLKEIKRTNTQQAQRYIYRFDQSDYNSHFSTFDGICLQSAMKRGGQCVFDHRILDLYL